MREMEAFSAEFLRRCAPFLRWYGAHWAGDPLHAWSRVAEYPWVAEHLSDLPPGRLVDLGSGLTFFGAYLTTHGWQVDMVDGEPRIAIDGRKVAAQYRGLAYFPRKAESLVTTGYDAAVCISVLEHMSADVRVETLRAVWRGLRPGGRLVLTLDVGLDPAQPGWGIPPADVAEFLRDVERCGFAPRGAVDLSPLSLPTVRDDLLAEYGLAVVAGTWDRVDQRPRMRDDGVTEVR
jgi:SAM-dependent methyltransferase